MKNYRIGIVLAAMLVVVVSAQGVLVAAPLATDMLFKDGVTITQLEDNDWESLKEVAGIGTPNVVEVGEILYGMFEVTDVWDASPGTQGVQSRQADMFAGVFVLEVAQVLPPQVYVGGATFVMKPAPAAAWTGLGLAAPVSANTLAVLYSDPDGPQNMVNPAALGGVAGSLATATNGTKLWEAGFAGGGNDPTEFWIGDASSQNIVNLQNLSYRASLNVTQAEPVVAGILLGDHDLLNLGVLAQVQFTGAKENLSAGNFQIRTDSDIYVRVVPEPATVAYLLFGAIAMGFGALVRHKK
jgi:hypothetical protein